MKKAEDRAKIRETLRNLDLYSNLIEEGDVDDKPRLIEELLKMIRILCDYAPLSCLETTSAIQLLRLAYLLTGNRYKLPQKRNY